MIRAARAKPSGSEEKLVACRALDLVERYQILEDLLGLDDAGWTMPSRAPYRVGSLSDAEDAARALRSEWNLGEGPIPLLAELLEAHGVRVLQLSLSDIEGMTALVRGRGGHPARVIAVKKNRTTDRMRFSLAHELGHIVLDTSRFDDEEKAANRFAGAFLLPAGSLRAEVGASRSRIDLSELGSLKLRFGISIQSILYRCQELGIISEPTFKAAFGEYDAWKREAPPEAGSSGSEEPKRFERLCIRAMAEDIIGESRVAELLGISRPQLEARLNDLMEQT